MWLIADGLLNNPTALPPDWSPSQIQSTSHRLQTVILSCAQCRWWSGCLFSPFQLWKQNLLIVVNCHQVFPIWGGVQGKKKKKSHRFVLFSPEWKIWRTIWKVPGTMCCFFFFFLSTCIIIRYTIRQTKMLFLWFSCRDVLMLWCHFSHHTFLKYLCSLCLPLSSPFYEGLWSLATMYMTNPQVPYRLTPLRLSECFSLQWKDCNTF